MKRLPALLFGLFGIGWLLWSPVEPQPAVDVEHAVVVEPPVNPEPVVEPSPEPAPLTEAEFADLQQWLKDGKPLSKWVALHPAKEISAEDVVDLVEVIAPEIPSSVKDGTATFYCPTCKGAGTYYGALCPTCDGASAVQFPPRASQSLSTPQYYVPATSYRYYPSNAYSGPYTGSRGIPILRRLRRR